MASTNNRPLTEFLWGWISCGCANVRTRVIIPKKKISTRLEDFGIGLHVYWEVTNVFYKTSEVYPMIAKYDVRQAYIAWQVAEAKERNWNYDECARLRMEYYALRDEWQSEYGEEYEDE